MSIYLYIAVPLFITAMALLVKSKSHPGLIYPGISLMIAAVINFLIGFIF